MAPNGPFDMQLIRRSHCIQCSVLLSGYFLFGSFNSISWCLVANALLNCMLSIYSSQYYTKIRNGLTRSNFYFLNCAVFTCSWRPREIRSSLIRFSRVESKTEFAFISQKPT